MRDNALILKPIGDLLDKDLRFYIPAYQRGYRWNKQQVTDLLDDIKEFQQNCVDGEFYCLQPIVVKQRNREWEVVDGQQRLTTIYIILTYLKQLRSESNNFKPIDCYKISYETRKDSAEFLDNINKDMSNIDFFHIYEAKEAVADWFNDQDVIDKYSLVYEPLTNKKTNNVQVIWYELGDHESATEVFTRLNMGKISLVNAELVKALFLKSSHFSKGKNTEGNEDELIRLHQLQISQEWDYIEKSLQEDAFWYFLSNENIKTNRIEFILNLRTLKFKHGQGINVDDRLKTFLQFNEWFDAHKVDVSAEWLEIKKIFMTLKEWFNDRKMFHLIGFLVLPSHNTNVAKVLDLSEKSTGKQDFHRILTKEIFKLIFSEDLDTLASKDEVKTKTSNYLSQLNYENGSDIKKIRIALLLFNITSLLNNSDSNARFQFERFKTEQWDIEHIRSVTSNMPNKKVDQEKWLEQIYEYLSDDKLFNKNRLTDEKLNTESFKNEINHILKTKSYDSFEDIHKRITAWYDQDGNDEIDNSIGNLTLLDSSTNRSYKNAIFPIKRQTIIALDKKATYVPLCTKNVFLKYYSKNIDDMLYWKTKDAEDYQRAMVNIITDFFTKGGSHQ